MQKLALTLFVALLVSCGGAPQPAAPAPTKFKLQEARIIDIQAALMGKQLTTVGLVELYLARIKAYNGTCVDEPEGILGPIKTIPERGPDQRAGNAEPAARHAQGVGLRRAQGAQHDRHGRRRSEDA